MFDARAQIADPKGLRRENRAPRLVRSGTCAEIRRNQTLRRPRRRCRRLALNHLKSCDPPSAYYRGSKSCLPLRLPGRLCILDPDLAEATASARGVLRPSGRAGVDAGERAVDKAPKTMPVRLMAWRVGTGSPRKPARAGLKKGGTSTSREESGMRPWRRQIEADSTESGIPAKAGQEAESGRSASVRDEQDSGRRLAANDSRHPHPRLTNLRSVGVCGAGVERRVRRVDAD